MNGYLTFVGDGKFTHGPYKGARYLVCWKVQIFGGEYTCKIDPKTKTAQVRHILRSKDETTITGYFDNADNLHILLKYFKYVGSEEAKSGGTKLVEDQSARSHELFSISAQNDFTAKSLLPCWVILDSKAFLRMFNQMKIIDVK